MKMFYILVGVVVTKMYKFVKIHLTIYFKWMHFILCKLSHFKRILFSLFCFPNCSTKEVIISKLAHGLEILFPLKLIRPSVRWLILILVWEMYKPGASYHARERRKLTTTIVISKGLRSQYERFPLSRNDKNLNFKKNNCNCLKPINTFIFVNS